MKEEISVFLDRARKFEKLADYSYKEKIYDLAAFQIEQAFQLYIKYILAKETGYFPKTHSLYRLFREVSKISKEFEEFYLENEIILKDIEDAYVLSRYFPREYSESEVRKMFEALEKFKKVFGKWISES